MVYCFGSSQHYWHHRNVISFGLFFSPAEKSVEEFKPDPYIATVLNCAFWVFYGMPFVHPNSLLVVTINGVGLVFEFVYLAIFFIYATNKGRRKMSLLLLIEAIFFAAIILVTMLVLHGTTRRSLVVGIICDVFNVMIAKVIKTKSVKYMPFSALSTNFLNGVCWTSYALIHPLDIYVRSIMILEQSPDRFNSSCMVSTIVEEKTMIMVLSSEHNSSPSLSNTPWTLKLDFIYFICF
ncbi:hypothetical protein ACSQ67_008192 [Phaseolus vulgaris]